MIGLPIVASAPAKVIIVGEHFVVEGEPAIAAAINLRAKASVDLIDEDAVVIEAPSLNYSVKCSLNDFSVVSGSDEAVEFLEPIRVLAREATSLVGFKRGFKLSVDSKIPVGVGLGSSASVLVASAAALLRLMTGKVDRSLILSFASKAEEVAHARPSGIDPTIATYGGVIVYRKSEGFLRLQPAKSFSIVIGDTGMSRSTGEMVNKVRALRERFLDIFAPLYHAAGHLVIEAARAIESGDLPKLGVLMNINHGLLSAIGVSNLLLEKLVYAARSAGAYGSKITGAGGGGSIIALCPEDKVESVALAIERAGGKPIRAKLSMRGVIVSEK
ncbi:MAG: mevalonate kinase [Candidatus Methanomethylicota archaeon]|uniref:Mevalonate kinase n=1 Tax=Thermoproteota archaeon TaxID=2056631 RepID=A0A497EX64_9CREN|nr:MAG: mevalonate kinase [Candidatus Verstraetearchaeota archaeon]